MKAEDAQKKLLCDTLVAVGVLDKVLSLRDCHRTEIRELLFAFQRNVERILPCSEMDVWTLQCRLKALQEEQREMKRKEAMLHLLEDELLRYHAAMTDAYDSGLLLNAGILSSFQLGNGANL